MDFVRDLLVFIHLLGMASLVFDDLPGYVHLNPWLASLFILPEHRSRGAGSQLVSEAEKLLVLNRVPRAYLFTESASSFFEKLAGVPWQRRPPTITPS